MPALDLELNSSSFLSGASAINSSIDGLIRGSGNLDNALLGVGNALQNFSMVGRDIKRMQGDLNAVTGQSVGIWGTLGAAIKANPVFAIATVLGVAASAMTLFTGATSKAADAQTKLADAMKRVEEAQRDSSINRALGLQGSRTQSLQAMLEQVRASTGVIQSSSDKSFYLRDLDLGFISPGSMAAAAGRQNLRIAGRSQYGIGQEEFDKLTRDQFGERISGSYVVSRDTALALARSRAQALQEQIDSLNSKPSISPFLDSLQRTNASASGGGSSRYSFGKGLAGIGIGRGISPDPFGANGDMGGVSTTVEQSLRAMQEMRALGEDIGQTLGNAFDRATQAGATFKSVLQGVLQDLRSIATSMVSSWLRDSVGSAFGGTPRGR